MFTKFCKIIIPIFLVALFMSSAYGAKANLTPAPKNKTDCEKLHGKWGRAGIFPQEFCNMPTKDANKVCNDTSECEGDCLANLTKDQIERTWRGKETIYTSGKCSAWRMVFGCKPIVRNGTVKGLFCQD
jgi:hypothetical protein